MEQDRQHLPRTVRSYLAEIGRKGGRRSRRTLTREQAEQMVRIREARRAFRRFYASCFWYVDPYLVITAEDIPWVAKQLRKHGDDRALKISEALCR